MVISVLPVSPPHVRPAIITDNGARGEDDITFKLGDILKARRLYPTLYYYKKYNRWIDCPSMH